MNDFFSEYLGVDSCNSEKYAVPSSFLPSNWNLDKNFALTGELGQVHMTKKISDFPPCVKMVIFVTEFVIFLKTTK